MSKEVITQTFLDHVHLHVDNIDQYQELFNDVFHASTVSRNTVGSKEIIRLDLAGSHILLTPSNPERKPGINHIGIVAQDFDRIGKRLIERGWNLVETNRDNGRRKQFFDSGGPIEVPPFLFLLKYSL